MTDRKGVLVRFPPELLADLDAEAKATGRSRHDVILARCEPAPRVISGDIKQRPAKAAGGNPPLGFGPVPVAPGSRLKKR